MKFMNHNVMEKKKNRRIRITLLLSMILLLFIDQWTKYLTVVQLKEVGKISIIRDVFCLTYLENYGAGFGIMQNQRVVLLCITVVLLVAFFWIFLKIPFTKRYLPLHSCLVVLTAGALGNMIDRIFRGFVVDMLNFELISFPVFNVADCYIVVAVILAFFLICFYYKKEELMFFKKKKE